MGIGANTALFGVFRSVFMTPLPLPESDRLTFVMETASFGCCGPASGPDYLVWAKRQRTFSDIGTMSHVLATLTGDGEAVRAGFWGSSLEPRASFFSSRVATSPGSSSPARRPARRS